MYFNLSIMQTTQTNMLPFEKSIKSRLAQVVEFYRQTAYSLKRQADSYTYVYIFI